MCLLYEGGEWWAIGARVDACTIRNDHDGDDGSVIGRHSLEKA